MQSHSAKRCSKRSGAEGVPNWLACLSTAICLSVNWSFSDKCQILIKRPIFFMPHFHQSTTYCFCQQVWNPFKAPKLCMTNINTKTKWFMFSNYSEVLSVSLSNSMFCAKLILTLFPQQLPFLISVCVHSDWHRVETGSLKISYSFQFCWLMKPFLEFFVLGITFLSLLDVCLIGRRSDCAEAMIWDSRWL